MVVGNSEVTRKVLEVETFSGSLTVGAQQAGYIPVAVCTPSENSHALLANNVYHPVLQGTILDASFVSKVAEEIPVNGLGLLIGLRANDFSAAAQLLQAFLALGEAWKASFLVVECAEDWGSCFGFRVRFESFCSRAGFRLATTNVNFAQVWPWKHRSCVFFLHTQGLPAVDLNGFPEFVAFSSVGNVVLEWPPCSADEDANLCLKESELAVFERHGREPAAQLLNLRDACPAFLGVPHDGIPSVVVRGGDQGDQVRLLTAREAALICSFPSSFKLESSRGALATLSYSVPPALGMWILLRFAESLYLPGSPLGPGSADQYLHAYLTSLVLLPSELERALSVSTPFNIQVACEESSFTVAVVSGTTAGQLVEAERRLLGRGFSIKLFADEHVVPEHALLQPRAYRIVRRPKVSARPVDSQLLCVNAWVTDHWDTVSVPAGTFVFQVARQLGLQGTTRIVENPGSMQVPLDSRIWQSVDLCFAACGDEDSAHNEGIDAAMLSAMARATPEICLAVESGLHYLEPEFLSALLLQEPQTVQETIAKVVPDDAGTVAGFVACDNHWALLVYERTRWPPAIYYDGIPDRLVVQARWLLEQLHVRLGAGAFAMQQASIVKQSGGTHCGGIALANLRWHLHSELSLTEAQVLAMYPCQGGSGPFVACGAADFASAQQWLQEFLPARGVPEAKASERAALALKRLGVNAILRCRQLPNPWRGLKELANTKQFQWVTYEELQEHIKVQSTMERGASSADRPRKQRKDGQATKADIKVALTPERLVLPKGAFVDQARSPVGQLTLNEVSSTARGVVIVSLEQALPFIKDGKPISVDALALLTVEPVPHELQGLLPVASLRWPAIYVGTNEPILICGSLVQLGDDVVAKAVSECTAPKSVATCLLRFQVYKDQFGDSWEAFVRGPVKMLCQRHACLQKCSAQNCGVACTKFHAPVDEEVDSVVLDAFGWRWFSQAGKVEPPGKASSFSVLIRVPVSASKAVVDLSGTDGLYVEPRSDLGKGPHPDYSVIWLPGDSHDAALHRKRTLDKVQHVTRLNGKYGLRVKVSDEAAVRAELFPGQHFVACKASEVFQAGPFPHGMTKQALQQFLQAASWTARPLRPVRSTLEGRFWEIGSESSPPSPILSLGQQDVTVSHVRSRQHPPPDASNLFASDKTLRHLQQVNADPWDSMDPWKAFAEQRKGHAAAEDVASSADSKLASLEQRLQASLEETVKARVHELQQDVDMSTAQTETGQHQEVLKLRTDLEELKAQNQKFEGWFKNAGDQVSCLQQQVGSLASQVQEQGVSNAALTQMVNSMQQSWRSELQSAMDSQTDRLEALLSKQWRTA